MRHLTHATTSGKYGRPLLHALLLLAVGGVAVWLIITSRLTTWDLRNNLWAPAYLLLHRQNPYDLSSLFELGNAVWMPMALGFFFPVGLLTEYQSSMLWLLLNIGLILLMVLMVAGTVRPRIIPFIFCLLAIFLYPPVISHLGAGQFTLLAVLLMLLATRLATRERYGLAAFSLALALTKPQLGILLVPGLLFYTIRHRGVKKCLWFVGLLVFSIILLTLPLFVFYPNWLPGLLAALNRNPTWVHPSLFSLFQLWLGHNGVWLWLLLFIILSIVNLRIWQKMPPRTAVYWSLALTGISTPYVWSYDFVIQLPLFIHAIFSLEQWRAQVILWAGYLLTWGATYWVATNTDADNYRYWFIPWLMLLTILAATMLEKRSFTHGTE